MGNNLLGSTTTTIDPIDQMLDERIAEAEGSAIRNMAGAPSSTTGAIDIDGALDERIKYLEGQPSVDPNIDTETGLKDWGLRVKLGFAETPGGREQVLSKAGLVSKRLSDGRLVYKNPDTNKLTYVDEEGLSLQDAADYVGLAPEIVGGVTAQILGGGSPIAGAMGAMTGNMVKKGIAKGMGIDEKVSPMSVGVAGAASLAGDVALGGVNKLLGPAKKSVWGGATKAEDILEPKGSSLTPAQMTDSGIMDFFESLAEGSFGGGPVIIRHRLKQKAAFRGLMDDIATKLGESMSDDQVGAIILGSMEKKRGFFMDVIAPPLFKKVDDVAGVAMPKTTKQKVFAKEVLEELKYTKEATVKEASPILDARGVPIEKTVTKRTTKEMMPSNLSPTLRRLLNETLQLPDEMTFKQAAVVRSKLLKLVRDGRQTGEIGDVAAAQLKTLASKFDEAMGAAAKTLGKEAHTTWRSVNEIYKQGMELFHDDFIKAIAKKNPQALVKAIIKPGNLDNMRKVKRLLGKVNKKEWDDLGSLYLKETLDKLHMGDPTKQNAAVQLQSAFNKMGERSMKVIFDDPQVYRSLRNVVDAAVLAEDKGLSKGASIAIKLTQFGAAFALMTGDEGRYGMAGSAFILVAPYAAAKLMTSKAGSKWLSQGLLQEAGTQRGMQAIAKITALMSKEEFQKKNGSEVMTPTTGRIPEQGGAPSQQYLSPTGTGETPRNKSTLSDAFQESRMGRFGR